MPQAVGTSLFNYGTLSIRCEMGTPTLTLQTFLILVPPSTRIEYIFQEGKRQLLIKAGLNLKKATFFRKL